MDFKEYQYQRPNLELLEKEFDSLLIKFERAKSPTTQATVISKINHLRKHFDSMNALVTLHHKMDTTNEYYDAENNFMDEVKPVYEGLIYKYYKSLINAKYRKSLERKYGNQLFRLAELKLRTFTDEIIEDLQNENKLVSQHTKLVASAKFMFDGKERTLSQMLAFSQSPDRETRRKIREMLHNEFNLPHETEFDEIFDKLVKVRHQIARKLGFNNFIELAYARLGRTDYDAAKVAVFRKQILEDIVPLVVNLNERKRKRLGLDRLKFYDEPLIFLTGNAAPSGDSAWIIENARIMYQELSPETKKCFSFIFKNNLIDLDSRIGKTNGGSYHFIPKYKAPFIFANFNGTSGDVSVLTHEFGHAFQGFLSRNLDIPEYFEPTLEASEIFSLSMELFTLPWMPRFYGADATKYQFAHLTGLLGYFPHGAKGDEFQHWVYEHPDATPKERKQIWREIEKKYLPSLDYDNFDLYERGGPWLNDFFYYRYPFYYIDYGLAWVCAIQLWNRSLQDRDKAWNDYLKMCKLGGSKSFLELIKVAELKSPFEEGSIKSMIGPIKNWLDNVEDDKL